MAEYCNSPSVPKEMHSPEICPECKEGKLEMQFGANRYGGFDVVGGFEYEYGKKSTKKTNPYKYSKSLMKDPITGKYPNPY
jgi:hypothetical protein